MEKVNLQERNGSVMNKSENINELAMALSKLQGEITDACKDKQGYGYNYADLSSVLDIARPALAKNGLAVSQLCGSDGDKVSVETVLMHKSGQWISAVMAMTIQQMKGMTMAQASGAVISYARRYCLASVLGIAQTDNDAAQVIEDKPTLKSVPILQPKLPEPIISSSMLSSLYDLIDDMKIEDDEVMAWMKKVNIKDLKELKERQALALVNMLNKRRREKNEMQA